MIIQTSTIKINVEHFPAAEEGASMVFLLHGFTGSSEDWFDAIPHLNQKYSYASVDLIGHGKSEVLDNVDLYKAESIVQQLDEVFNHFTNKKFFLIGYSMGGRAALTYAVHHQEELAGLVLESTSAGIADEKLRAERRQSDEEIIKMIEEKSIEEFVEFWMNQDLFATLRNLPHEKFVEHQKSKVKSLSRSTVGDVNGIKNQKIGLINSLKGFGTGVMPPLYNEILLVRCKTLLITGELDKKFTQINKELVKSYPNTQHVIIKNAGHNVHLEKLEEFVRAVNEFLNKT